MKRLVSALAAAALMVSPLTAAAQGHGGMGGRGGGFGHGGFAGSGGFGRGFAGHGFRGGFYPYFGFGLGYALAADPWFYAPYWWDYGPPYYPYGYYGPDYYDGPPPPGAAPTRPAAFGQWVWHAN